MNYPEAIQFLYDLRMFGAKLGLENTFKLAELSGNPQRKLRFIHVAGTNGKGSTCAMLESIYRAAGYKTGLFTSPHLVSFTERMQVNRKTISEGDVARLVADIREPLKAFPHEAHPTFFEVVTLMALKYFAEQNCEIVIWETGMGGRLDATNIVTPLASVITNVQLDHQKWLGETLDKIAFEKAGIIKEGVPVITATDAPEALKVIRETALGMNASLTAVSQADTRVPPLDKIELPLLGAHQRLNAVTALATVRVLRSQLPVSDNALCTGLQTVEWAGRMQLFQKDPRQTVLVDGAHNPDGAIALRNALKTYFPRRKPTLIVGMLADKSWEQMCGILAPLASRILLVPVSSDRTAQPADLAESFQKANRGATVNVCGSLAEAFAKADSRFIVVSGSLYLVGEAIELLRSGAKDMAKERSLNEWFVRSPAGEVQGTNK